MNVMNEHDNQESNKPQSSLEDLAITKDLAEAVKGGDRQAMLKMFTADYCGTG
jgi:hypothetical protein